MWSWCQEQMRRRKECNQHMPSPRSLPAARPIDESALSDLKHHATRKKTATMASVGFQQQQASCTPLHVASELLERLLVQSPFANWQNRRDLSASKCMHDRVPTFLHPCTASIPQGDGHGRVHTPTATGRAAHGRTKPFLHPRHTPQLTTGMGRRCEGCNWTTA